jgi:4-amino-4-deoxy-L-arabinose transferase-like glycosyltransferase
LIIAAAVRLYAAYMQLWFDELASIFFAKQSWSDLWGDWMVRETNPPLYYSILKIWLLAGWKNILLLRFPSIAVGLLAILVCFRTVREIHSARAGYICAMILALSAINIQMSHEMRSYIFGFCAIAISNHAILRWQRAVETGRTNLAPLMVYALGATLALYCHTTMILWPIVATIAVIVCSWRQIGREPKLLFMLIGANLIVLLAASWWIWMTYLQMTGPSRNNVSWMRQSTVHEALSMYRNSLFFADGVYADRLKSMVTTAVEGLAVIGVVIGVMRSRSIAALRPVVVMLLAAIALFVLAQLFKPIAYQRTLLWLNIFTAILCSVGLASVLKGRPGIAMLGLFLLLMGVNAYQSYEAARDLRLRSEAWVLAADQMKGSKNAALVVMNSAPALLSQIACDLSMKGRLCPYAIVMIQDDRITADYWAHGQVAATPDAQLARRLAGFSQVFIFKRLVYNPFTRIGNIRLCPADRNEGQNLSGPHHLAPKGQIDCPS